MTKHVKGLWAVGALMLGLGVGFTAGSHEVGATSAPGIVECSQDSQCDARCDGPGSGACQMGRCYCRR